MGAVVLALGLMGTRDADAARHGKPLPCPGGRFAIDRPFQLGAATVNAVQVTDTTVIIPGCGETVATRKATKRATVVRARWSSCETVPGTVFFRGQIVSSCGRLKGKVVSPKVRPHKHPTNGALSSCGDRILDSGAGEQCDGPGGCAPGIECTATCRCREPGKSLYDVTYTPQTVVIPGSVVDQKLLRTEGARYVFAATAAEVQVLTPGQVVLLSGLALRRVSGVTSIAGEIRVDTEDAKLNDAIADGAIEWDHPFDLGAASASLAVGMHRRAMLAGFDDDLAIESDGTNLHYEGTIAGVSVSVTLSRGDERIDVDAEFSKTDGAGFKCTAKGWVRGARILGRLMYESQILRDMRLDLSGLEGEITLATTALTLNTDTLKLALPLRFPFPIAVGPIPILVTVGVNASVAPVLAPNASSDMQYTIKFSMDQGVHLEGGSALPVGTLYTEGLTLQRATTAGLVPVAMAFGLELPSAKVNVLGHDVAFAAMISVIEGYLQPLLSEPCQQSGAYIRGVVGFNISFLGLTQSAEKELFRKERFTHRIGTEVLPGRCP